MAGFGTWEGWDGEVGVVEDEPDLYLLIGSAGGHVPRRALRISDATEAAARAGLHVPRHWSAPERLVSALQAATRARGIAVGQLAKAIGISKSHASRLLEGERCPGFRVACRWAHHLGLSLLLGRTELPAEHGDDAPDEPVNPPQKAPTRPAPAAKPASDLPDPPPEPASDRPDPPPGVDKPGQTRAESREDAPHPAPDAAGVAKPDQDGAGAPCDSISGSAAVAKPDHSSAIVAKPDRDSAKTPGNVAKPDQMSAAGGSRQKNRRSPSTSPRTSLSCEGMAVEFRRGDSVRFAFSTEGMDPEAVKREIYATMKLNIAAGTTPYIDDQPFDMTLYHLEMRIDAEAAQRKADILASEQRILSLVEARIAEVIAKFEGLQEYTRQTFDALGVAIYKLEHKFTRAIRAPELIAELGKGILNIAGGDQDKKKEKKDDGN